MSFVENLVPTFLCFSEAAEDNLWVTNPGPNPLWVYFLFKAGSILLKIEDIYS